MKKRSRGQVWYLQSINRKTEDHLKVTLDVIHQGESGKIEQSNDKLGAGERPEPLERAVRGQRELKGK